MTSGDREQARRRGAARGCVGKKMGERPDGRRRGREQRRRRRRSHAAKDTLRAIGAVTHGPRGASQIGRDHLPGKIDLQVLVGVEHTLYDSDAPGRTQGATYPAALQRWP